MASNPFVTRMPPQFASVEDERRHRLERLAATCRIFGQLGFAEGLLGHVTVRDPQHPDLLWLNPMGVSFKKIKVSQLVQVDHSGTVRHGDGSVNPVGLMLHSAIHEARPEVTAVCHAHSLYGKAWASLGRLLDPISQDACVLYGQQALIREPRLTGNAADAALFATAFGDKKMAIQVGHGLFSTGLSVDEAAWWFISMQRACQVQLLAEAAGQPELWPEDRALGLARGLGSPQIAWMSFQTLWDEIVDSDPDFLD